MNKFLLLLPFVFIVNVSSVFCQEKITVKVFPEIERQTIRSIGGDYCQARLTSSAWDTIGATTLKQFRPEYVRVALPMKFRGVEYDDFKGSKIVNQPLTLSLLNSLRRMKTEFGVRTFVISVWDVPDVLVENPGNREQRIIKPEAYDEVLDILVAFLVKARDEYGVEADYFSFNESDGGWQVIFSPRATQAFIKKAMARFKEAGLKTKFLLADTAQTKGTVEFATQILGDSTIWSALGPLSFHCWWSENIPDAEFERIAALGKALNKPVWCTELGFDAMAHKVKGMFQSWDYALRFAKITHRMMRYAEVEVSMYWTWQNDYALMSPDLKTLYPSYFVTRHWVGYLNKGTRVVHSLSSDPAILCISGIHPDGKKVLQLINLKKNPVEVSVEGISGRSGLLITTTETNYWQEQKILPKAGKPVNRVQLQAQSVNTLILD